MSTIMLVRKQLILRLATGGGPKLALHRCRGRRCSKTMETALTFCGAVQKVDSGVNVIAALHQPPHNVHTLCGICATVDIFVKL